MRLILIHLFFFSLSFNTLHAQENIFDACRSGNMTTVEKLYKINPSIINSEEENGYSALVLACYYGHEDIVAFLAGKVSNINAETTYGSPLMAAAVKGYDGIVDILLKHNANPNITDDKGTTAAHYAILFKKYTIIEKLANAKADFTIKNEIDKSALDYAKSLNDEKINKLLNL